MTHAIDARNDFTHGRCAYSVVVSAAKAAIPAGTDLIDEINCLAFKRMNVRMLTSVVQGIRWAIDRDLTWFAVLERMLVLHQPCLAVLLDYYLEKVPHHSCYCGGSCRSL